MSSAVAPTLGVLREWGIDYRGVLYAGLMLTADGPKVLEFNVRFGDPETQVVLPRLSTGLAALLEQAAAGDLYDTPAFVEDACVTVVMASEGYPAPPRTGDVIEGIEEASALPGVTVFCAGVARDEAGRLVTAGGRVLDVTATGATIAEARQRAYAAVDRIHWPGAQHRTDIAADAGRTGT